MRIWAEKELKNLSRVHRAGVPCPRPLFLRRHVLVMSFIGTDGTAAPQLREADLSAAQLKRAYRQVVRIMHALYHECQLVHADLSGYNLLWSKGRVHVIDVAQGVTTTHPSSEEFLRTDCHNITDFFGRRGVAVVSEEELASLVKNKELASGYGAHAAGRARATASGGGGGDAEPAAVDTLTDALKAALAEAKAARKEERAARAAPVTRTWADLAVATAAAAVPAAPAAPAVVEAGGAAVSLPPPTRA